MRTEVTLQLSGKSIGVARLSGVSGRQAVDGVIVMFTCELELQPTPVDWIVINDVTGRLSIQGLGDAAPCWPLNQFSVRSGAVVEKAWFTACVALNDAGVRAVDRYRARRAHGDIQLELWFTLRGTSSKGPADVQAILKTEIGPSDWFGVLAGAQYEARHIIDVPIQGGRVSNVLADAAEHYRRALEQWKKASYPQVFTECRKVLESTREALNLRPKGIAEFDLEKRTKWSNRESIDFARAAIHQIVHHSAHPGVDDDPGAAEAELLLALTGSLLRFYADTTH
jgi:hypothetical protein